MHSALLPVYARLPVTFSHGNGVWLWDLQGKQYLDGLSGVAVCALGHAHPAITSVIKEQACKLIHCSNGYEAQYQELLAEKLQQLSGLSQSFFVCSGTEANETAIKLCRLYGHQQNIKVPNIIVMEKGFHGYSLASLTASANRKVHAGFEPLVQGFIRSPYNDIEALEKIAHSRQDIAAVMLEPIQGSSGIHIPDDGYLAAVRKLCDEKNWLMVLDEVQSGLGRTGKFFAYQHENILPDIATLAKGLGNGIPIGTCIAHGRALDLMQLNTHGSTFGGNPLTSRTALTVLEIIEQNDLMAQAASRGKLLLDGLKQQLADVEEIVEIRGKGLMIGIEFNQPCKDMLQTGLEQGVLFSICAETIMRLLPPFIISESECEQLIDRISKTIKAYFSS